MTLRRLAVVAAVLALAVAVLLILSRNRKHDFEERLAASVSRQILSMRSVRATDVHEGEPLPSDLQNAKLRILSDDDYPREIRYYRRAQLIAIDNLDESGEVIRRDIVFRRRVRVRQYYDGELLLRSDFVNAKVTDVEIYVPFPVGGGAY